MVDEMLHRRLLEAIDLAENVRERRRVGRAEVATARRMCDFIEQLLVDFHRHRLIAQAERPLPRWHRRLALCADANRVDLDAECRRGLRGRARIDRALVVLTVGEQDHDLALPGGAA